MFWYKQHIVTLLRKVEEIIEKEQTVTPEAISIMGRITWLQESVIDEMQEILGEEQDLGTLFAEISAEFNDYSRLLWKHYGDNPRYWKWVAYLKKRLSGINDLLQTIIKETKNMENPIQKSWSRTFNDMSQGRFNSPGLADKLHERIEVERQRWNKLHTVERHVEGEDIDVMKEIAVCLEVLHKIGEDLQSETLYDLDNEGLHNLDVRIIRLRKDLESKLRKALKVAQAIERFLSDSLKKI